MSIELQAVRIYAPKDQYGDKPRIYQGKNPITFDNYPDVNERLILHFGNVPEEIVNAHSKANARGELILDVMFGGKQI